MDIFGTGRLRHNHDVVVEVVCNNETMLAHITIKRMNKRSSYYSKTYIIPSGSASDFRLSALLGHYTKLNGISEYRDGKLIYQFNSRNERIINDGTGRVL